MVYKQSDKEALLAKMDTDFNQAMEKIYATWYKDTHPSGPAYEEQMANASIDYQQASNLVIDSTDFLIGAFRDVGTLTAEKEKTIRMYKSELIAEYKRTKIKQELAINAAYTPNPTIPNQIRKEDEARVAKAYWEAVERIENDLP